MPLKLINPLLMDSSNLRTSLLPSLIKTIKENLNQGNSYFDGFEYGHTYFYDTKKGFYEKEIISGIFGGSKIKNNWSESGNSLNWFRAKGKIDGILKQLKIVTRWQLSSDPNYTNLLHPYRSAELYLPDDKRIGLFGQINPILAAKLNISSELHLFEFDFDLIKNVLQTNKITIYKEYSLYPKIVKDLSFVIHRNIAFSEIRRVLLKNGTRFLNDIKFLDEYRSESLMPDHISLCLQLIFQSQEKTLENKLIENIVKNLEFVLTSHFNAELRC
jgi:phenylalanyl-tRNA synthetase beta chain